MDYRKEYHIASDQVTSSDTTTTTTTTTTTATDVTTTTTAGATSRKSVLFHIIASILIFNIFTYI